LYKFLFIVINMNNSCKRKLVSKRHGTWIIANQTDTDIAGSSGEILKQQAINIFS